MRTLKNINDNYLISNGNNEVIYLKINKYEFTSFYDDYIGLYTDSQKFTYKFETYQSVKFKKISYDECQLVMKNNCKVRDLWEKYFGN